MSISRRTSDALLGVLVVSSVAVLCAALIFTQGWNERRFDLYMFLSSAQDLSVDTKVVLQGLEIGRVTAISPQVDPSMGPPKFVATLRLRERYQSGAPLILPIGTHAEIQSPPTLGSAFISVVVPVLPYPSGALRPGDTIPSIRKPTSLDAISQIADSLRDQIKLVLDDTRQLISRLGKTTDQANLQLAETAPAFRRTLAEVNSTLSELRPAITRASTLMANADDRVGSLHDSVSATLSQARVLMSHLDSLSVTARSLAVDNQASIHTTVQNLEGLSRRMDYFFDQVSRRPLRMITGVRPQRRDSTSAIP